MITKKDDPFYYVNKNPQPREIIKAWHLDPWEANILEYLARWREKDGIKDLKKLIRNAEFLIEDEEEKEDLQSTIGKGY